MSPSTPISSYCTFTCCASATLDNTSWTIEIFSCRRSFYLSGILTNMVKNLIMFGIRSDWVMPYKFESWLMAADMKSIVCSFQMSLDLASLLKTIQLKLWHLSSKLMSRIASRGELLAIVKTSESTYKVSALAWTCQRVVVLSLIPIILVVSLW